MMNARFMAAMRGLVLRELARKDPILKGLILRDLIMKDLATLSIMRIMLMLK
jgi:hypothetical protein